MSNPQNPLTETSLADQWFEALNDAQRPLLIELRKIILAAGKSLTEEIRWRQPCYKLNRHVCYLNAHKSYVVLGFQQGAQLEDPQQLLEGTSKTMRHIRIRGASDIKKSAITKLIKSAISVDASKSADKA